MNLPDQNESLCHIELLGPLRVTSAGQTQTQFATQKAAALLAYLALRPGLRSREQVIDLLWPDMELAAGRNNLSTTLVSLRRLLEPPGTPKGRVLAGTQAEIGLNPDAVTTDAAFCEDFLKRAARSEEVSRRVEFLRAAVSLHRGDILPGQYQDWAIRESERFRARLQEALPRLMADLEALGDLQGALETAQRLAALDPYSEETHCELIRLYVQNGQRALAKEAQARFERLFTEEFGAAPSAAAQEQIAKILSRLPAPAAPRPEPDFAPSASVPLEYAIQRDADAETKQTNAPLPVTLGRYFGREAVIVALARLLLPGKGPLFDADGPETPCRLLTITGPGGMGKTRLALEFARQAGTRYGFWRGFVSLADLTRPEQIPAQITSALKLPPDAGSDPLAPVYAFLNAQDSPQSPPLLILDNMEHLLPVSDEETESPALTTVQALLERVPGLVILCVSRRRLGMRGERQFALSPLPTPEPPPAAIGPSDLAEIIASPSVRLYVDRAQAARPDFALTVTNAPAVVALCRQLEGSPLALELAAAWARTLPPRKMWERLTQGLDIPPGSYADLPARHRTLSAALDWSLRLLTPAQARLFARLSVFRGGWTLEAAEMVCAEPNALLLLAALQEASLVLAAPPAEEEAEEEARYAFLETVRTFSLRQAEAQGDRETRTNCHAAYFLNLAELAETELRGPEQAHWLARLEAEHDNLRAALDWTLSGERGAAEWEQGARLAAALARYWNVRGHWREAMRYLDMALTYSDSLPRALRARLLNARAGFARLTSDFAQAKALFEESLRLWRQLDDPKGVSSLLHNIGLLTLLGGDPAGARPYYEESLALERERSDPHGIADELHHLGWVAHEEGDLARARALYEESLAVRRPLNDLRGNAFTLQNLANVALAEGNSEASRRLQRENMAIRRELGDRLGVADSLHALGLLAQKGDRKEALRLYQAALDIQRELGDRIAMAQSIETIAAVLSAENQDERACRLFAAAAALRAQAHLPCPPAEAAANRTAIQRLQERMAADFAPAWQAGNILNWGHAAAEALAGPSAL